MRWPTLQSRYIRSSRARRGVLILVVLSLLALFLMMGVAFVLTAGQQHSMSQQRSTARNFMSDPRETLDAAMYQLLRDTRNDRSSIRFHSLLNDLYGNDGFMGAISAATATTGTDGAFINITIPQANVESGTDGRPHTLSQTVGAYAGSVFTVVSGSEVGRSARIVGYDGVNTLTVANWKTRNGRMAIPGNLVGARAVINGRPFNGMGAGYNPTTGKCDLLDGSLQCALLPNRSSKLTATANASYDLFGMDEPYDAPDYQNMFMASVPVGPSQGDQLRVPIPSFHRQDLFNYWSARTGGPQNIPTRCIMRPMHANFGGELLMPALPAGNHTNDFSKYGLGPWDVDNDGDYTKDSVWVDLGFPDATSPDGFPYRPLFAFLVLDLDGRLNLNAAGNSTHYDTTSTPTAVPLAGSATSANAPAGQGIGPAEIRLDAGPTNPAITLAEYQALLEGNANWHGRYGSPTDARPGLPGQIDKGSWYSLFGIPANFFSSGMFQANFLGRPLDFRGHLAFGLDSRGLPAYEVSTAADDRIDNPYEIDLSRDAATGLYGGKGDAPFSVNELEWLLRPFDRDTAGLPSRIPDLAPSLQQDLLKRRLYTTHSNSLPVPITSVSRAQRVANGGPYRSIIDLLKQRLMTSGLSHAAANDEIVRMVAPEMLRGERLNLNRLFGNGVDDNGNGVVDDPSETTDQLAYPTSGGSVNVNVDYINGDATFLKVTGNTPLAARQLMARYLYVLAMLARENVNIDFDGNPGNNSAAETARGLAQWAVNVVDFRDADSIMTPFEYDINPFNGWNVDGDLTTDEGTERGLVWGCERPELLITETVAWHDRATEDRNDDTSMQAVADGDTDWDQRFRPSSAAFIELYAPWAVGQDKYPAELYTNNSGSPTLHLNRLTPQGNSPIWRMIVVQGNSRETATGSGANQAHNPDSINSNDIERSIYFSNNFAGITGHGVAYYPSDASLVNPIVPGGYAVVGSAGRLIGGEYVSTIGHRTSDPDGMDANINSTRRVVLTPSSNQVGVRSNTSGTVVTTASTAAAIVLDSPRSFSVSEPDGVTEPYYANSVPDPMGGAPSIYGASPGAESKYNPPIDAPLDAARSASDPRWAPLMQNATAQDFRTIHLQRLANPLIAWHPQTNPYITVDVSTMNLTAFNGASNGSEPGLGSASVNGSFAALQRGNADAADSRTLWRHEFTALPTALAADTSHFGSPRALKHSLGYINERYGAYGQLYPNDTAANNYPFPWLTWNNRPYISPKEVMLVPRSGPSRLGYDYTALVAGASTVTTNSLPVNYQTEAGRYGHLLHFFDARANTGTHLYRLFEYLGVPSQFAGTREVLSPITFGSSTAPAGFRAPHIMLSNFREPGRININTINDGRVWDAILGEHGIFPEWRFIVPTRRGYGANVDTQWLANTALPSFLSNPFRGSAAGDLVPLTTMERLDIDATLMRSYPNATSGVVTHTAGDLPVIRKASQGKFDQADRNPFFRFQQMIRTENLVTTQSNVYAVWVTMGYFQVQVTQQNLMRELWEEVGTSERYRAFYLIDRSIPVAFEPGENHNVDDAVLIRRMLD